MSMNLQSKSDGTVSHYLKGEWAEKLAVLSKVWVLSENYMEQLEKYFLLRSDNETLLDHIQCTDTGDLLRIGVTIFNVEYMNCSWNMLDTPSSAINPMTDTTIPASTRLIELVISCRVISSRNFAVAIVQPRYAHMTNEKYYSLRELDD